MVTVRRSRKLGSSLVVSNAASLWIGKSWGGMRRVPAAELRGEGIARSFVISEVFFFFFAKLPESFESCMAHSYIDFFFLFFFVHFLSHGDAEVTNKKCGDFFFFLLFPPFQSSQ